MAATGSLPAEALKAFEESEKQDPNRFRGLYGGGPRSYVHSRTLMNKKTKQVRKKHRKAVARVKNKARAAKATAKAPRKAPAKAKKAATPAS